MPKTVLIIALFMTAISLTFAQDKRPADNRITVQGNIELRVLADRASFAFSLKGVGPSLRLAVEDAGRQMKVVTEKIISIGIPAASISTSRFYSGENKGDKAFLSSSRDYQATLTTLVKIDSLPLLEPVLYSISESNAQSLSNIEFGLKDELESRRRARTGAAFKAKEKAEDLARAMEVGVGRLMTIEETDPTRVYSQQSTLNFMNPFNPGINKLQAGGSESTIDESIGGGFFAQTMIVTSQVRAVFEIIQP